MVICIIYAHHVRNCMCETIPLLKSYLLDFLFVLKEKLSSNFNGTHRRVLVSKSSMRVRFTVLSLLSHKKDIRACNCQPNEPLLSFYDHPFQTMWSGRKMKKDELLIFGSLLKHFCSYGSNFVNQFVKV